MEVTEEASATEASAGASDEKTKTSKKKNVHVPPGKWRVGAKKNTSQHLFLRFATKGKGFYC